MTAQFELPGLTKENVNIDLRDNVLTVSGECAMSSECDERGYSVRERRFGKFARSLPVPQGIKVRSVSLVPPLPPSLLRHPPSLSLAVHPQRSCCCWSRAYEVPALTRGVRSFAAPGREGEHEPRRPDRHVPAVDARAGAEENHHCLSTGRARADASRCCKSKI